MNYRIPALVGLFLVASVASHVYLGGPDQMTGAFTRCQEIMGVDRHHACRKLCSMSLHRIVMASSGTPGAADRKIDSWLEHNGFEDVYLHGASHYSLADRKLMQKFALLDYDEDEMEQLLKE